MLKHDANGVFVRASWEATPEPQTRTVYAVAVKLDDGTEQVWGAEAEPLSDERWIEWRRTWLHRLIEGKRTIAARRVAREITVTGTEWRDAA